MSGSLDEANFGFALDAPYSPSTGFYLLIGDNAYGQTAVLQDQDAYQLHLDKASSYSITASDNSNGFTTHIDIYDANGHALYTSTDQGTFSGLTFTANDNLYFVVTWSEGTGYYRLRVENNTVVESNGVGEPTVANQTYNGSLDYTSDSDHFLFSAVAGHTYQVDVASPIPALFLKVCYLDTVSYVPQALAVTPGAFVFTASVTGTYEYSLSANSYVSTGAYAVMTHELFGAMAGTDGADTITGTSSGDSIYPGSGSDEVHAGLGNDTIGEASGQNYLRGDEGDDLITGGTAFDDINGNMGNDTVSGGLGDDWTVGGKDNDSLSGDAGSDVVWGNLGNDTCSGGDGNDQVRGGQGDDSVSGGAGDDYVSGDRGNDTISGGSGADLFHGSQDAGIDRVLDFHLSEGDRVFLDPGTTYTLNQVGADTVIDMGGGHQMILVGIQLSTLTPGWIFGA